MRRPMFRTDGHHGRRSMKGLTMLAMTFRHWYCSAPESCPPRRLRFSPPRLAGGTRNGNEHLQFGRSRTRLPRRPGLRPHPHCTGCLSMGRSCTPAGAPTATAWMNGSHALLKTGVNVVVPSRRYNANSYILDCSSFLQAETIRRGRACATGTNDAVFRAFSLRPEAEIQRYSQRPLSRYMP